MTELVFGIHSVNAKIKNLTQQQIESCEILVDRKRKDQRIQDCLELAQKYGIKVKFVAQKKLDSLIKENHQGVVLSTVSTIQENNSVFDLIKPINKNLLLLILDGITDPHNLGACLRTADCTKVDAVIVPSNSSAGITPVVNKVSSGASLPFFQVKNLARFLKQLQDLGVVVFGADEKSETDFFNIDFNVPTAIILGNEGSGLRRLTKENCNHLISIPVLGNVQSLNVSVACGVILYQVLRSRL